MKKASVLIIDDEPEARNTIAQILEKDCATETASSGKEAIEKMREKNYDIALLDIRMPDMDGMETLKKIFCFSGAGRPKVIMLTALDDAKYAWEASKIGASDFITKPFDNEMLITRVKMVYENKIREDDNYRKYYILSELGAKSESDNICDKRKRLFCALSGIHGDQLADIPIDEAEKIFSGEWDGKTPKDIDPNIPY